LFTAFASANNPVTVAVTNGAVLTITNTVTADHVTIYSGGMLASTLRARCRPRLEQQLHLRNQRLDDQHQRAHQYGFRPDVRKFHLELTRLGRRRHFGFQSRCQRCIVAGLHERQSAARCDQWHFDFE
jgi:hypothetical protein